MTREFSDELLSAHLDGELTDAERATVETQLAASEADRQLYQDLKSLRGEMASLPRANVSPDFADRVVRAALAEAEKQNEARGMVSRAPPVERHFWRRGKYGAWGTTAAAGSAVALAACFLLVVLAGRRPEGPQAGESSKVVAITPVGPAQAVVALADQFASALSIAGPTGRDAVILRLKASKDGSITAALDEALAKAGITAPGTDAASLVTLIPENYAKMSPGSAEASALAAVDAVFIEAPLQKIQGVFADLGTAVKDPLLLQAQGKLALHRGGNEDRAEGEGNAAAKPFAQHLDGKLFRLFEKSAEATAAAPVVAAIRPEQAVRVLILVEP